MGKFIGSILSVITSPLSIIDKDLGNIVSGVALIAIGLAVPGAQFLVALGVSRLSAAFQSSPRPETAETAILPTHGNGYFIPDEEPEFGYDSDEFDRAAADW